MINNSDIGRLGSECRRLEIKSNIGRPNRSPMTDLNARRLQTRAIPVSPPIVLPRPSSVPLDRLTKYETPDCGFMILKMTVT